MVMHRTERRTRRWLARAAWLALAVAAWAPSPLLAQSATVTADEGYLIGTGTGQGVSGALQGPFTQGHLVAATRSLLPAAGDTYLYVVAASDDTGTAGVLADFLQSAPASGAVTGVGPWTACAAGAPNAPDWDPPAAFPVANPAGVNAAIAACNAGGLAAGTTSVQWVGFYDQGGGVIASGEDNTSSAGDFGTAGTVATFAHWMWFNPAGFADPFSPGATPGKEYYIFRLPLSWIQNKVVVSLAGDYHNTTGGPINSFEWTISGIYTNLINSYNGPYVNNGGNADAATKFGAPTLTNDGTNTTITWPALAPIATGKFVHLGFTVLGNVVSSLATGMDPNSLVVCNHQLNVHVDPPMLQGRNMHTPLRDGFVTFDNAGTSGGNCESTTLFVRNVVGEWYEDDLAALEDLLAASQQDPSRPHPGPIRHFAVKGTSNDVVSVAPGATSAPVRLSVMPTVRTNYGAIIYTVGTSAVPDPNDSIQYALIPVFQDIAPIPTLSEWGMIAVTGLLLLTGALMIRKRGRQAPTA